MTMHERELRVSRTARYYTMGGAGAELRDVWIVCHGYGQLAARFARPFVGLASDRRCIVAPEGLSRFYVDVEQREKVGAAWMTREHRAAEIADYVAYLDAVYDATVSEAGRTGIRLTAFGFSQGASTVSRWAAFGRYQVQRLILWGGELPPDLNLAAVAERFRELDVVLVRGTRDELITAKIVTGIMNRLRKHNVRHRLVEFDGGHELDAGVLAEIG